MQLGNEGNDGKMMWEVKTREVKSVERKHGKKQVDKVIFKKTT